MQVYKKKPPNLANTWGPADVYSITDTHCHKKAMLNYPTSVPVKAISDFTFFLVYILYMKPPGKCSLIEYISCTQARNHMSV